MHDRWVINLTLTRRRVLTQIIPDIKPIHCDNFMQTEIKNEQSFIIHSCHLLRLTQLAHLAVVGSFAFLTTSVNLC